MKKSLPKTLFVRRETDRDETYLIAEEKLRDQLDIDETRLIGRYSLVEKTEIRAEIKSKPVRK